MKKTICVIDGQGGNIGATIIKYMVMALGDSFQIVALGTNPIATATMIKAGAHVGGSGENAIQKTVCKADCIVSPIAVTWANTMLGEVTPEVAQAVMDAPAIKILIPMTQESVVIAGVRREPLPHLVQIAVSEIMRWFKGVRTTPQSAPIKFEE
ncbi:MAG: DUF3842 family protein [Desulfatibacillaceae bacterium]